MRCESLLLPARHPRHHLNYGIFLLAAVGGYSVFRRPIGRAAEITALLYGVAMGLTFDEFGMWLHLGGVTGNGERGCGDCRDRVVWVDPFARR